MKRSLQRSALLLLTAACASVPRDAGRTDIQRSIADRTRQTVAWASAPATADDPRVATLLQQELTGDNAVAVAMANSPRLQAILADVGVARADLLQASLVRNPLFEAELRFPRDPFRPFELRLAQTLVDLIQLPRRRALGRAAFEAAKLRVTGEVLRFAASVRAQQAELLASSQRAALSRVELETAQAAVELAQRQHDVQNITDLELETEQARYEQAKLDAAREAQSLLMAREAMIRALGRRDASAAWRLPEAFPPLPPAEDDPQALERLAASRRIDVSLARAEVDLRRRAVPLARLAVLGDITADIHYQRDASGAKTVGPGIELPIPIFNSGAAARSRAEAEYLRAAYTLEALLAESSSQLRAAGAAVAAARARVEYYRDVVLPRRQRIVELTKLEHNAMLAGVFQLLDAKRGEAQAQRDFVDAQRDYWIARNDLDRAVNGAAESTAAFATDPMLSQSTLSQRATTSPRGGH